MTDEVDKIASHDLVFIEQTGRGGPAIIIVLVFKPQYNSDIVRYGREFQVDMRVEQLRRAGLST